MRYTSLLQASACAAVLALMLQGSPSLAASHIYTPHVTPGELEFEYFGSRTVDASAAKDNKQKHQFAVAYGMSEHWKTELYGKFEKSASGDIEFEAWEFENIFAFTEEGDYWLGTGASFAYEWTPESDVADAVEARLLLSKAWGKTSHLFNAELEKQVGSGPRDGLEGKLLWSSRYRYQPYFDPGFEIESDFGELEHTGSFREQKHAIGPFAYGKIPLHLTSKADGLKYRVGYLFGVSEAAEDGQAVVQLEYELHF
jgi:hypothetical protein